METKETHNTFRCPECGRGLPVFNVIGDAIVFCKHCGNKIKITLKKETDEGKQDA